MSATENSQQRRVHSAYHEAGHALVAHVIGRVIEEVSIAMRDDGSGGSCRFNPFIEDANDHPEWRDDLGNPELITIYYAGMLATAYACAPYVTYDEDESRVAGRWVKVPAEELGWSLTLEREGLSGLLITKNRPEMRSQRLVELSTMSHGSTA